MSTRTLFVFVIEMGTNYINFVCGTVDPQLSEHLWSLAIRISEVICFQWEEK